MSGKPLLAHDPHLGLAVPSVWYFIHLSAPGLDIIGATLPGLPGILLGRNHRLAWKALNDSDTTPRAFLDMARAVNLDEFVASLRDYETPQQNIVYADVDGHIAFYAPGRIPRRRDTNDVMGRLPVPGWYRGYDWDGYIPFEEAAP